MSTHNTVLVLADLRDSKERARKPGGIEEIRDCREKMHTHLHTALRESNNGPRLHIKPENPKGDNIELRVSCSNRRDLAETVLRALPRVLVDSRVGPEFRYTAFHIEPGVDYYPRFSAFTALGKGRGKPYYLAIDLGIIQVIGRDVACWYDAIPSEKVRVPFNGEAWIGVWVHLCCEQQTDIPAPKWSCKGHLPLASETHQHA